MAEPAPAAHALGHPHGHGPGDAAAGTEHRVKDPVCGMSVDPHTAKHRAEHGGRSYYFCSAGCRTKFLADPARYLDPAATAKAEPVPEGTVYTCPMHPEIRQVGPGHLAAIVGVVSAAPQSPAAYKARLEGLPNLSHVTVEVHPCPDHGH